ncbi:hypothetical protein BDN70DRAFT_154268 [Pholiota conissans]|uniref:Uncharacterized protein n=1 Tax=Pholiota conissans TaxID=109636 RepID=A0A9P5YXZ7_9AGAR|nr:hypothetical protein BDN70DRAFT_154268 [Pholiota conissans]
MFGLSTADVSFSFRVMITDFRLLFSQQKDTLIAHVYPKSPIFVSNNFIADMLLLYRCYMIWNQNKYIAISSSILLIADTVWGWIGAGSPIFSAASTRFAPAYYWTVFGTNIIMTAATAGRIYCNCHSNGVRVYLFLLSFGASAHVRKSKPPDSFCVHNDSHGGHHAHSDDCASPTWAQRG